MSDYVTVTIPERLYRRARDLAQARRRSLDAVIAEALEQGMPSEPAQLSAGTSDEDETAIRREMMAFIDLYPVLREQYPGRHVAILDGRLVDHDADAEALYRRIVTQYPDRFVWLAAVTEDENPLPTLHSRSPRLVGSV